MPVKEQVVSSLAIYTTLMCYLHQVLSLFRKHLTLPFTIYHLLHTYVIT